MLHKVLAEATGAELAAAVSDNLYALFQSMSVLPGYTAVPHGHFSGHYTPLDNPMFRGVWAARLSTAQVEAAINQAVRWFEERGAPDFMWWLDERTQPPNLVRHLLACGFDGNLEGDPSMALDLTSLNPRRALPAGLQVVRVTTEVMLEAWRDVFTAAFGEPAATGQAWADATLQAGLSAAPWSLYTGVLEGRVVATSMVYRGAGVAGVYSVGTLPEVRRQGIGAGITAASLREAQAQGERYAVLFASRLGTSVYRSLGFQEVGSIRMYLFESVNFHLRRTLPQPTRETEG